MKIICNYQSPFFSSSWEVSSNKTSMACACSLNLNFTAATRSSRTRGRIPFENPSFIKSLPAKHPIPRHLRPGFLFPNKRRRFIPNASSSLEAEELPLLPFPVDQVLVPSESKTLHLYEARYLALLDESLFGRRKHFIHFVLDPIGISDTAEPSFAARYGCLVLVDKVERLDVGALVSIRGIGRAKIIKFVQADPYLKGIVIPMLDVVPDYVSNLSSQIMELKEALHCLNSLELKLKAPREALLQTQIASSVKWAEKECSLDCYGAFFPSFAERLSFAALQPVSGLTRSELLELQKEKLRAMDVRDTLQRVDQSLQFVKNNISMVAAKLAIQSLEAQ